MSKQFRHKRFMQGLDQIAENKRRNLYPERTPEEKVSYYQEHWANRVRKQIADLEKPIPAPKPVIHYMDMPKKTAEVIPPVKARKLTGAVRKGLKRGKAA